MLKAVYVYSVLKPECAVWDHSQHEPLGIFISLLLRRHEPWRLRHTQPVVDLARALREVPDDDFVQKGHLLCDFCCLVRQLETMPASVVRGVLHTTEGGQVSSEVAVARPGDHLFCPFQCELCHFRNIQGRSPNMGRGPLDDTELMKSLRRINMDDFWSREPTKVSQNLGMVNRALQIAHEMGLSNPPMPKLGPWKLGDEFGAGAAAIIAFPMHLVTVK
jgi:hypothetical protein